MSTAEPTAHCMVDLETLGKKPGCVILSIGAQIFDPEAGTLGASFHRKIDRFFSEQHYKLAVDFETLAWWEQQSEEARRLLEPGGDDLAVTLNAFTCFWQANGAKYFWCHGAGFDEPILAEAFVRAGLPQPWEYNGIQCCRTELKRAGVKPDRSAGIHHDALDDARAQALAVIEANRARPVLTAAAIDVIAERRRQIAVEGWTPEHDDEHKDGSLARAAASYAVGGGLFAVSALQVPLQVWPYRWNWNPKDPRTNLVRAGALIVAEIERLDRAKAKRAVIDADGGATLARPIESLSLDDLQQDVHYQGSW